MPRTSARSQPHGRVIVVGSTNTDLVVHCPRLPQPGESVLGGDLLTFAGGKGANQAVAAARAGAQAVFIGAFGDDAFGRARRADLEREGVDCSGCVVKKGVPSGVALIAIGESKSKSKSKSKAKAENLIFVAPGANTRLTPEDVRRGMPKDLGDGDVVLCCLEVPLASVARAFLFANRVGAATVLNPAPFPAKGLPRQLVTRCNLVVPNEVEFAQMTGAAGLRVPPTAAARRTLLATFAGVPQSSWIVAAAIQEDCGTSDCVVTRGARGVLWYCRAGAKACNRRAVNASVIPAPKVTPVDTVGAGDCFNGCLAARLAEDRLDRASAIRFAVTAAAIKVTRHGAQAGMPYRAEILKKMERFISPQRRRGRRERKG